MTTYECKECKVEVKIVNGLPVLPCGCNSGVTANLKATARGAGSLK